eukprot:CAMPEP_0173414256 /NCGR_PEP_ID=MMETSP1356-20130122/84010_1 /TAXON_ID=77927 ORGANISM="Hemiselmis virescens, Strain PCC157" /NCGR_SAMPLE_ID=MMETSP1356 /ASSEMBLY_ACC=CAM_ASM_000847 /LENGTH=244 /DNA_ID=CAMNT_0014376407 /DNA_START=150 /DNA_END=881 /DNA_ORIENTATION=+
MSPFFENEEQLMEGPLHKKASGATGMMVGWRERRFVLTTHRLLYYETGKAAAAPKGTMTLADMRHIELMPEKKAGKPFCLSAVSPTCSWIMRADSQAECERWLREIKAATKALDRRPVSSTMPPSRVAPLAGAKSQESAPVASEQMAAASQRSESHHTSSSTAYKSSLASHGAPSSTPSSQRTSAGNSSRAGEESEQGDTSTNTSRASNKRPPTVAASGTANHKRPPLGPHNAHNSSTVSAAGS